MAGFRKPSVSKSISARTTGRVKRSVKRATNPFYGKRGTGFVTNPKRSVKNAVYHRTTIGGLSSVKSSTTQHKEDNEPESTFDAVLDLIGAILKAGGALIELIIVVAIGWFILSIL